MFLLLVVAGIYFFSFENTLLIDKQLWMNWGTDHFVHTVPMVNRLYINFITYS